ncbi:ABC transporter ATP-binding protein [Paenibacillus sp. PSB04]|uniref:ABC transporter ATP-binding protein n=1 Tax=Paenibacillus sp. PSB04 TaxID=2866810 RepID=UPI0021F14142|nr:ABC transporter ATP-binding protein [Paenibacillus sp. PSB04]UYO05867.1 ABC transporter ATP-binding protein/permease [Paenibacillus sp. PSB04]
MTVTRFIQRLFTYNISLFIVNGLLWGLFHSMPLLLGLGMQWFFDRATGESHNYLWLVAPLIFIAIVRISRTGVFFWAFFKWVTYIYDIQAILRTNMLKGIMRWPGRNLPASPGEAVSRFREDVDEVVEYVESWVDFWGRFAFAIISLVIMARINWQITLVAILPLVAVTLLNNLSGNRARRYGQQNREATGRITSFIAESFGAVQALKLGQAEEHVHRRFVELNESRRQAALKDNLFKQWMRSLNQHVLSICTGIILLMCASAMKAGQFTVGDFALFTSYMTNIAFSISLFGYMVFQHKRLKVSLDRMSVLFRPGEQERIMDFSETYLYGEPPELPVVERSSDDRLQTLEIRNLSYTYPGSENGITDVNFAVTRGQFVVITGRIGSGKSTLVRTLLGLLPKSGGDVRWNGRDIDPAAFLVPPRSAYTPQVPRLFSDTLQENIVQGSPPEADALARAIRLAVMEKDIEDLEKGLDTFVGPRGVMLSGGQIQRAATARMMMTESDLFIFDDLSSALDVETEKKLWEGLFEERDVTCIAVSHRRAALAQADHIIVMKDGRIEAEGSLAELLESSTEMQLLWQGEPTDSSESGEQTDSKNETVKV